MNDLVEVDIDSVGDGVMVYGARGMPLGVVRDYLEMNGDRPAIERRHLDNGSRKDRFAYRREILYAKAKAAGPVFVRG